MPYEIPQNLKYEEKVVMDLGLKQFLWLMIFGGIAAAIYFKSNFIMPLKMALAGIFLLLAIAFAFLNLWNHVSAFLTYARSLRLAGYLDEASLKFMNVKKIENDTVYTGNNSMKAILQVFPINFTILSKMEQQAVIAAYKDFLNSLDFPIQITMRTVNLSIDDYFEELGANVKKSSDGKLHTQYDSFRNFVREFIESNSVRNRVFYIVVPSTQTVTSNAIAEMLKLISFGKSKKMSPEEIAMKQLDDRVKICVDKLAKCSLVAKRLSSDELVSLFASYFEGSVEVGGNYFFPLTLLAEHEKLQS